MNNRERILIVTECFYPEEFKINDVAIEWKKKGYEVDVLTMTPTYPQGKVFPKYKNKFFYSKDVYEGVTIYRIFSITGYRNNVVKKILRYLNFMLLASIISIFIGKKYHYVFGWNGGALTDMLPAVIIHKLYKKPTMLWVQDVWPDSVYAYGFRKRKFLSVPLDLFVKFIYSNISAIAISSKGFEAKLKPYVRENLKFNYAPNWADELDFNLESADLGDTTKVHFTFAGNVGKVQNLENIIDAFKTLSTEYQNKSQLNIIGDGSNLEHLQTLSQDNQNIVFHGKKPRNDMASFYKASDFLIISLIDKPIFRVTVPAKTQTYIAAQKPILAIINGDVADIIKENNLGICADPSDLNKIKKAFIECIDMKEDQKLLFNGNNAILSKTIFNKNNIIDNLYLELTNKHK